MRLDPGPAQAVEKGKCLEVTRSGRCPSEASGNGPLSHACACTHVRTHVRIARTHCTHPRKKFIIIIIIM